MFFSPVGQGSDHQAWRVAQILVAVPELGVADVCKAILLNFVPPERSQSSLSSILPPVTKLGLPTEGCDGLNLLLDHLAHCVPAVHVDCADRHHLMYECGRSDKTKIYVLQPNHIINLSTPKTFAPTFCLSPLLRLPNSRTMRALSCEICFL